MLDEVGARQRQADAAADNARLNEARYRAGIDTFLTTLDAQRSYYSAQRTLVATKLEQGQNLVDLYQALGGDELIRTSPIGPAPAGS